MASKPLTGLHFCLTGEFGEDRTSIVKKLISLGATWHRTVTAGTNLLIAGVDPGKTKVRAAKVMCINVEDRDWLVRALRLGGFSLRSGGIDTEEV